MNVFKFILLYMIPIIFNSIDFVNIWPPLIIIIKVLNNFTLKSKTNFIAYGEQKPYYV